MWQIVAIPQNGSELKFVVAAVDLMHALGQATKVLASGAVAGRGIGATIVAVVRANEVLGDARVLYGEAMAAAAKFRKEAGNGAE